MNQDEINNLVDEVINKNKERSSELLIIKRVETLDPTNEGLELNQGYTFAVDGPLPEVADGIAKMAQELDRMDGMDKNSGAYFIELICQFYKTK